MPSAGTRQVPFSRELYIERDDFMEDPPKKFFRLAPGREVRLRNAYLVTCTERREGRRRRDRRAARHLRSGDARRRRARRPQGQGDAALGVGGARASTPRCGSTIGCSRRGSGRRRGEGRQGLHGVPQSGVARGAARLQARAEPRRRPPPGTRYQFERLGYFSSIPTRTPGAPVFNRTVSLKDTWARSRQAG